MRRSISAGPTDESGPPTDLWVLVRLWPYARPYRFHILAALVLLPMTTVASISQTLTLRQALDRAIVPKGPAEPLLGFLAVYLAFLMSESLTRFAHGYLLQSVGQRIQHDLRSALVERLVRAPMSYLDHSPVGRLVTRATNDLEALGELFSSGAVAILGDLLTIVGVIAAMFWLDSKMALFVALVVPVLCLCLGWFRKRFKDAHDRARVRIARMGAHLTEALTGVEVLKVTGQETRVAQEYDVINREYRDAYWWSNALEAGLYSMVELLGHVTVAGLIWMSGGAIVSGRIGFGTLVAFLRYVEDLFSPLRDASAKFAIIQSAVIACGKVLTVLEVEPELTTDGPAAPAVKPVGSGRGEVVFENVSFAYTGDNWVLHDISLTIRPGERVAVVGTTGSGKTTLVKILCRLYPVRCGRILLDGTPIEEHSLAWLRREVTYLPQDPHIFSGTLAENISLGRGAMEPEAVERAARAVHADTIAVSRAGGYEARLAEKGADLSAGERQLVSLARIVLTDPRILVLDEATSSVDTFTEQRIGASLEIAMRGRTTIIIAHRLATIRSVDRILVVAGGRLVEQGTHDELLAQGGVYARLHELQFAVWSGPLSAP